MFFGIGRVYFLASPPMGVGATATWETSRLLAPALTSTLTWRPRDSCRRSPPKAFTTPREHEQATLPTEGGATCKCSWMQALPCRARATSIPRSPQARSGSSSRRSRGARTLHRRRGQTARGETCSRSPWAARAPSLEPASCSRSSLRLPRQLSPHSAPRRRRGTFLPAVVAMGSTG